MAITETQAGLVNTGVAAGSSIGTGIINGILQSRENKRNRQFAKEQADIAYQRQRTLIDEQRNYDSISSQMQRYIEAGLNPNLVLGNVTAPGSPGIAPKGDSPMGLAPHIGDTFNSVLNAALTSAQIRNLDAQTSNDTMKTEQQIQESKQNIAESLSRIGVNEETAHNLSEQWYSINAGTKKILSELSLMSEQRRSLVFDNYLKSNTLSDNIGLVKSALKISNSQATFVDRYWAAQIFGLNAQAKHNLSMANLNAAQQRQVEILSNLYDLDLNYRQAEYNYDSTHKVPVMRGLDKSGNPLIDYIDGLSAGAAQSNSDRFQTSVGLSKTVSLLMNYGSAEHAAGLIKTYSDVFNNVCDGVSDFVPKFGSKKTGFGRVRPSTGIHPNYNF